MLLLKKSSLEKAFLKKKEISKTKGKIIPAVLEKMLHTRKSVKGKQSER